MRMRRKEKTTATRDKNQYIERENDGTVQIRQAKSVNV